MRWGLVLLLSALIYAGGARAEQDLDTTRYHQAVEYCRGDVRRPAVLSTDRKIVCFDGPITFPFDASQLEEGGLFVVRSFEGVEMAALAISEMLLQRRATVVIYDYCLSVCSTYFFFASVRTYVMKGTLVAWHDGGNIYADCPEERLPNGDRSRMPRFCVMARQQFYSRRSNDAKSEFPSTGLHFRSTSPFFRPTRLLFPPTSPHIDGVLYDMYAGTGVWPNVAWTLSPTSLHPFKTRVHYEAYPTNQDEVDEMAERLHVSLRLGFRKVIYDR